MKPLFSLLIVLLLASQAAWANTDADTKTLLIKKLTRVQLNLAPNDASKIPITLRLADLHAERGRIEAMAELDKGCTVCEKGREDRLKAIEYYEEVLPKLNATKMGTVLAQLGHLYQLVGEKQKALQTYKNIIAKNTNEAALSEAHLSLGEIYFRQNNYEQALTHYNAVMGFSGSKNKGLAAFRKAWAHFNLGQIDMGIAGLRKVLSSPALLTRSGEAGVVNVDKQFQEEVSRDFATFLSRKPVTMETINELFQRSPESTRQANLAYLAKELERLGKKPSAIMVWRQVLERESIPKKRMEGLILLSNMLRETGQKEQSIQDYKMALRLWPSITECKTNLEDPNCKEFKSRLRKYILDWNRQEKKNPSEELYSAYKEYLKFFGDQRDMNVWAAQVARKHSKYDDSIAYYQAGAKLARMELEEAKELKKQKELRDLIETLLLSQIEVAELSKNKALLVRVYDHYLETSPNKKKVVEVRYQKARLYYDEEDYQKAAPALREIALLESGPQNVKQQAAELALDALVILKDDTRLENWAVEFAGRFPTKAAEFNKIARTSILNQAAQLASQTKASADTTATATPATQTGDLAAWETLQRMNLQGASVDERISYLKNKLVLAERLKKFGVARRTVGELLAIKTLKPEDREYALTRKAWLAEMVLDFDTALTVTKALKLKEMTPAARQLRLAMFADLSGKNAEPFLKTFLKIEKEGEKALATVTRLVRESKTPEKTLKSYRKVLSKNPKLYSQMVLEIYAKDPQIKKAKVWLKDPLLKGTVTEVIMKRHIFGSRFEGQAKKLQAHKLDDRSQNRMARSLKRRLQLIEKFEKLVGEAVAMGDWTSQILALNVLADESERFYNEILSLPIPEGLTPEQQQEYMGLLSQQAAPHQLKANDVRAKLNEFWTNTAAIDQKIKDVEESSGDIRALAQGDLERVVGLAPDEVKTRFQAAIDMKDPVKQTPDLKLLETARQNVRENPESYSHINSLVELEKQMGNGAMVSYLEARLSKLDKPREPASPDQTEGSSNE